MRTALPFALATALLAAGCAGPDYETRQAAETDSIDPDRSMNDVGPAETAYIEDREGIIDDSFKNGEPPEVEVTPGAGMVIVPEE